MYVYILISRTFDPSTMDYSDTAAETIEGVYKDMEDADRRRLDLEHEEELLALKHPGDDLGWTDYRIEPHEVR